VRGQRRYCKGDGPPILTNGPSNVTAYIRHASVLLVINQTRLYSYFLPCGAHAFAHLLGAWAREWRATGGVGVREREGEGEGGSRCAP